MGRAELVLFHLLIGNSDAHGKNISFYVGRNGIDVAPAYDLVNVEIYGDEYDRDMAMAVGDCLAWSLCLTDQGG